MRKLKTLLAVVVAVSCVFSVSFVFAADEAVKGKLEIFSG